SEFSREACPARFSSCILTAYDARQRSRRRRIGGGSRARALSERVPDLPPRGVPEHLLARRAWRPHAPAHRGVFRSLAGARSFRLVRRVVGRQRSKNRSEEHTSELQSLAYLVCRLLLEKKNKKDKLT